MKNIQKIAKEILATDIDQESLERKIFDGKTVDEIRNESWAQSHRVFELWYDKLKIRGVIGKDYGYVPDKIKNLGFRFPFKIGKMFMIYIDKKSKKEVEKIFKEMESGSSSNDVADYFKHVEKNKLS